MVIQMGKSSINGDSNGKIIWMPFFHRRQGGAASYFYHIKS